MGDLTEFTLLKFINYQLKNIKKWKTMMLKILITVRRQIKKHCSNRQWNLWLLQLMSKMMNVRLQQINRNLLDLLIGVGTHLCNSKIRFQGPEIIPTKHQSLLVQMTRDQISSNSHSFNFKNRAHKINLHLIFRHRTNRYNQLILKRALFQDQSELSYQPDHIQILT